MTGSPLPPKKQVALSLLEKATVFVHLDPRHEGVRVPPWFKKQPQLVLQVGLNMTVPIPDLNVDDDCMSCTLSFSRSPFFCYLPWHAIYAIVGEDFRGMVWPDDVPPEVAAQLKNQQQQVERPGLRAVPSRDASAPVPGRPEAVKPRREDAAERAVRKAISKEAAGRAQEKKRDGAAKRKRELRAAPTPSHPSAHSAPSASAADGKKGKRQLPPYLRVVK